MSSQRRFRIGALVLVQVFLLTFASLAATERWASLPLDGDDMYALLVLGSDQGPPRSGSVLDGRSDAIHLIVIDGEREHVSIMSFPRDSYVPVAGMGTTKINAMLTLGPENAVETMENLTGIEIDDWIVTGFNAMVLGVEAFGRVTVDVEQRLKDSASGTDLQPGVERLSGWTSLAYSRDRHSRPDGDIGRSTGQAKVLEAMHVALQERALSPALLMDLGTILRQHTVSSIPAERMVRLGVLALRIDPANVEAVTMPGRIGTAGSASVIRLTDAAYSIMEDVRTDGRLSVFDSPTEDPADE